MNIKKSITNLGSLTIRFLEELGTTFILLGKVFTSLLYKHFPFKGVIQQIYLIGYKSISMIALTSFFMGMVIAFSTGVYLESKLSGVSAYTGGAIAVAFIREIGPIITSLLMAGKSGSAVAAEIGSMVVTEQVDAMITMGVRPVQYLILPRVLAGGFAFPILTFIADLMGIIGGSIVAHLYVHQSFQAYYNNATSMIELESVVLGFVKSIVLGLTVIFISCSRGYFVKGGTESVGISTTQAVVISSLLTVILDYFMTAFAS
jgi:phospholipid/cholesterol/gamma-HCH transport system permease protein